MVTIPTQEPTPTPTPIPVKAAFNDKQTKLYAFADAITLANSTGMTNTMDEPITAQNLVDALIQVANIMTCCDEE